METKTLLIIYETGSSVKWLAIPVARMNVSLVHFGKTADEIKLNISLCCMFK